MEPLPGYPDVLGSVPLGRLLSVAGHLVDQHWGRYLAEHHGLTPAGMRVLFTLTHLDDATHRDVADRCFVRPATLTGIIDTLERDGFVERRRDDADRRSVRLVLTDKGRERTQALVDQMHTATPLTSVDADPARRAVIRDFLIEVITTMSDGEDKKLTTQHQGTTDPRPGSHPC
ncbi:MarR family winged helix-turn-helix transcriptional regulator [Micromonospora rifamycinica]|uniref:MarR family winged helix-turn-helix transcriptional regulator n=1 Tax=Micromonospora rifamycinica TaxID=291594 RepID=UPI002E2B349B|nr:MarR family winged helix-turn-helix transcriptional regulator [Micromonospora rifamycinica]